MALKKIDYNDSRIHYSGRMEKDPEFEGCRWVFAASSAFIRFKGSSLNAEINVRREGWDVFLGVITDGVQSKIEVREGRSEIVLADGLDPEKTHEVLFFKRMDTMNIITIMSFQVDDDAVLLDANKSRSLLAGELGITSGRRIEFFGDSVSCGEVSEAVLYTGKEDPDHNGEFSNSWYSYAWMTARKLHAEIHDTSQGGIALLDGIGWYHEPGQDGMESFFDKCQCNKFLAPVTDWDFSRWTPQIVVIALGQNDSHPEDFMKNSPDGKMASKWKERYAWFIHQIKTHYPFAKIICATTILCHDPSWDEAIDEVVHSLGDPNVTHFLYSKNGCGTPGHIRISEADMMSDELACYIDYIMSI
ncbi:MAG: electron transporter RnfD [Candidatus Weimeria sp.]